MVSGAGMAREAHSQFGCVIVGVAIAHVFLPQSLLERWVWYEVPARVGGIGVSNDAAIAQRHGGVLRRKVELGREVGPNRRKIQIIVIRYGRVYEPRNGQ